jgi:putative nucleotidyltransferase with HDIG domain
MRIKLPDFFLLPQSSYSEKNQKSRILHITLWILLFASIWIGILNLSQGATVVGVSLLLLTISCFVGLYLNYLKHYRTAAFILCTQVFLTMGYNLVDGAALHDPGIAAYPIFIVFASYLFGKRAIIVSTMLSILSVSAIYFLGESGLVRLAFAPTLDRVALLSILFVVTGCLTWVILGTWETALAYLSESYDMTLKGWAKALDLRDGATQEHSRRVADLCASLAKKIGCGKEEIAAIRRGAYLHDIGKMALPDRILLKKGVLTDEDWKLMRQHPALGQKMIAEIPFLQPSASIPYSHHENWDGSGYPEGLKGEQIPLAARIFTVVDHWDALSSDRRYRKAWPRERILAYFEENAGKIYDPQIVKTFLTLIANVDLIADDELEEADNK